MNHRSLAVLIAGALATLTACTSPWEASYEPARPAFPPTERVAIRQVAWTRVDDVLRTIEADRAASDTHPDEWPQARLDMEKADLLRALQLSEPPEKLEIIGRSVFTATEDVGLLDGSLSSFATSIGADYAVWSSTYLGKADTIEREPVTTTGYAFGGRRGFGGHRDFGYYPYQETIYVPVVVQRDQFAWLVYYVRVLD